MMHLPWELSFPCCPAQTPLGRVRPGDLFGEKASWIPRMTVEQVFIHRCCLPSFPFFKSTYVRETSVFLFVWHVTVYKVFLQTWLCFILLTFQVSGFLRLWNSERLSNWIRIAQQVNGRTGIWTKAKISIVTGSQDRVVSGSCSTVWLVSFASSQDIHNLSFGTRDHLWLGVCFWIIITPTKLEAPGRQVLGCASSVLSLQLRDSCRLMG